MTVEQSVIGHGRTRELLTRMLRSKRRGHAYLLHGPDAIGKRTLAESIFFNREEFADPDFIRIKVEPESKNISVDQVRNVQHRLSVKPLQAGGCHEVLIEDVDSATESASNALLKVLEEPPAATLFFLTATHVARVPQTIRSRCIHISMGFVPMPEITDWLRNSCQISSPRARLCAVLAGGRPGQAYRFAHDQELLEQRKELDLLCLRLLNSPADERMSMLNEIMINPITIDAASRVLQATLSLIRDILAIKAGARYAIQSTAVQTIRTIAEKTSFDQLRALCHRVTQAQALLRTSASPQLLTEYSFLTLT